MSKSVTKIQMQVYKKSNLASGQQHEAGAGVPDPDAAVGGGAGGGDAVRRPAGDSPPRPPRPADHVQGDGGRGGDPGHGQPPPLLPRLLPPPRLPP
jgi:hypothetical protein